MEPAIRSKALEVNLEQTRQAEIILPERHRFFIGLSETHYGIHNRAREFFNELHHPFSNRAVVVRLFPNISNGDYWFYQQCSDPQEAFMIMLNVAEQLLNESLAPEYHRILEFSYLKLIKNLAEDLNVTRKAVDQGIRILEELVTNHPAALIRNVGFVFNCLGGLANDPSFSGRILSLGKDITLHNLNFWETTTNIESWYVSRQHIFGDKYSQEIREAGPIFFSARHTMTKNAQKWEDLVEHACTFPDLAGRFRRLMEKFDQPLEKFHYLFYLIQLPGLDDQRDQLLSELNQMFRHLCADRQDEEIVSLVDDLFILFREFRKEHNQTVLDSMLALGKEMISLGRPVLIAHFVDKAIGLGFASPDGFSLSGTWHSRINRNHVRNIRVWLELIESDPLWMHKLLYALIINLNTGGIYIFDNDLFQRDVTQLLNSNISGFHHQIKQLCRIFPVYFNEIGAEGELREITTTLDEITRRKDKLIHYFRKQIHTEGNNAHLQLTLKILLFWKSLRTEHLTPHVPQNVVDLIDLEGELVTGVHQVLSELCDATGRSVEELPDLDEQVIRLQVQKIRSGSEQDRDRVALMIRLYQLLREKYSFGSKDICKHLEPLTIFSKPEIEQLRSLLDAGATEEAMEMLFLFYDRLNKVIFNPEPSQGWENIYHKRHIAYGIPSMYGEYHETKFEALGITFRLEQVASALMDNIIWATPTEYLTTKTLKKIYSIMSLMREGLRLDGISDQGLDVTLQMFKHSLSAGTFSARQYINLFQFLEDSVKEIIRHYFFKPYDELLKTILTPVSRSAKSQPDPRDVTHRVDMESETFYRDLLSSAFMIRQMDFFTGQVVMNLRKMVDNFPPDEIRDIMSYDPDIVFSPFDEKTPHLDNQIFLGSKGYYLKKLYLSEYPVPPGFILTTEVFRCRNVIVKHPSLLAGIYDGIESHIRRLEEHSGRKFGDPLNPLLLSIRSGSAISMPGAMNTFLNVGMNDAFTETLSKQPNFSWTSWDCYRRLLQTWGMSFGMDRNVFDQIILDFKKEYGIARKIDFPVSTMRSIAMSYKKALADHGVRFEEDIQKQVRQAVFSVIHSWDLPRTSTYRNYLQIADEWGTAVIIQQMVFGNIHRESGSGVLFTLDAPDPGSEIRITGDFSFLSQGEDIVAGLVNPLPISRDQRAKIHRGKALSLEESFPKIFEHLKLLSSRLIKEEYFGNLEMEFTFETPENKDLYILQIRDYAESKSKKKSVFVTPRKTMKRVGRGTGIGNEVMNGLLAFDGDDISHIRTVFPGSSPILVRPDTVPDDIEMIFECDGLLTAKGGVTSHAAVTAARLGKICIVNCSDLVMDEVNKTCMIGKTRFIPFDKISLDSAQGIVFEGHYPIQVKGL